MKRTPLERRTGLARGPVRLARNVPLSRRTGMARQPAQRAQAARTAPGWGEDTRTVVSSRSKGVCEMRVDGCTGTATDLHHRQRRREGNHGPVNALHLCRSCHSFAHGHPAIARAAGWIVSAHSDPAAEPVRWCGRLVWLTDDGRYVGAAARRASRADDTDTTGRA